jgi:hypothetical protein
MHPKALAAAVRGYTFLKEHGAKYGLDVSRLNPDTLDLASGCDCALAQAYGSEGTWTTRGYWAAIQKLAPSFPVTTQAMSVDFFFAEDEQRSALAWERAHGFIIKYVADPYGYIQLTEAWRAVIKANRDGETVTA